MREPTFRDFVCLYIAEGYKRDRNVASLANSDPAVVKHADQNLSELREFWAGALATDAASIGLQRKSNSNQLTGRIWRSRHGVLTVRVCDTALRARLGAWMDRLRDEWQLD